METFSNHDEELKKIDIELCNIYFKAIDKLLDLNDQRNVNGFSRYLELLRPHTNAYCEFFEVSVDTDESLRTLLFDNFFYRLAYVYRNSTLHSSAVAFHFQNVLDDNPKILERLFRKQSIHLCSIGCGPASDIVALIIVLESSARRMGVSLDIKITAVDANLNWKNVFLGIMRSIPRFEKDIWNIKFIEADLSQFFSLETMDAILTADVVSLMKFTAEFESGYMNCRETINEISENMSTGSLLFFLDRSHYDVIKSCGGVIGHIPKFCLVYEEFYDLFNLHVAAIEKNYRLYEKRFGANVLNSNFKVFCRAWIKSGCVCNNSATTTWYRTVRKNSFDSCGLATENGSLTQSRSSSRELKVEENVGFVPIIQENLLPESVNIQRIPTPARENQFTISNFVNTEHNEKSNADMDLIKFGTRNSQQPSVARFQVHQANSDKQLLSAAQDTGTCELCQLSENCLVNFPGKRFETKRENFDTLEFFRVKPYRAWNLSFSEKRMKEEGWNRNGKEIYYQLSERKWEMLFIRFQEQMEVVRVMQKKIKAHAQENSGVIDHDIWKEFMASKRELAFIKRSVYSELVITYRGLLKSKFPIINKEG